MSHEVLLCQFSKEHFYFNHVGLFAMCVSSRVLFRRHVVVKGILRPQSNWMHISYLELITFKNSR